MKLVLGTRGSALAVHQSETVAERLRAAGHEVRLERISTRGDQQADLAFQSIGAPGVFVRELERALVDGRVDLVVHSYKDLPTSSPPELGIAAIPERRDVADRLLARPEAVDPDARAVLPLLSGARVGTASARRRALIHDLRPDLEVVHLRGNVPTRIDKLRSSGYDAILLAAAGLDRLQDALDLDGLVDRRLEPSIFVPAPSQGALAVQARHGTSARDREIWQTVDRLGDPAAQRTVSAERRLQAGVEGGCQVAFGAWCRPTTDGLLRLDAVLEIDGGLRRASGNGSDPLELADRLLPELRPEEGPGE